MFNQDFFIKNRQKLKLKLKGKLPVVLSSNGQVQRNGDVTFKFRQDSNFWYYTGIEYPDIFLVIDEEDYLIIPEIDDKRSVFDGSLSLEELRNISGIKKIVSEEEGFEKLFNASKIGTTVSSAKSYISSHGLYINPAKVRLKNRLIKSGVETFDVSKMIIEQRMIKSDLEIQAIKKAVEITSETFKLIADNIKSYENEKDVEKVIDINFINKGVDTAYPSIVASGLNACTLHYIKNNKEIDSTKTLLVDAGAEFNNYASDITRTFFDKSQKRVAQVFKAVERVQDYAFDRLKPGKTIKEFESEIEEYMGDELKELGLIKDASRENIRKYYPHATSHHLGLDTHDAADYEAILKPGMVMTVEPGIYIPEESIGVRIEDDVLLTGNSLEVLSAGLSRKL